MTDGSAGTGVAFPFSAVVGHDEVKLALLLNAVDPRIGGVLLRGQKGSAKTTLARGLATLLGQRAPFVELPIGATEDRLVGSLDLAAVLSEGERRFQPGLLAAANGGVLYVDEVNLLPDHLVDVLLDVAASGVNRVEREGVSHIHESRFVLVGSMNPEEGDLRPQLLDRFGLAVDVVSSTDVGERAEVVARRLEFDRDPASFAARWAPEDDRLRTRLGRSRPGQLPAGLLATISALCAGVGAEGLRADIVISRAAAALAGWEGREGATVEDVRRVAGFALAHRRRRGPLEQPGIEQQQIDEALADRRDQEATSEESGRQGNERTAEPDEPTRVVPLVPPGRQPSMPRPPPGRRTTTEGSRGRLVADRQPEGPVASVAVGATVRAAAIRRADEPDGPRFEPGDLREAVREQRAGALVVLTVDASGSMGAERRMEAAKGAVVSLLLDAYQRRDRVALVAFREMAAEVVLRPTGSVEVARARLAGLTTGGRTPLAAGIDAARRLAEEAADAGDVGHPGYSAHRPLIVLVSDGRATAAAGSEDPVDAALQAAATVRRRAIPAVVVDAEDGPTRLGLARGVAEAMGARYLRLPELSAGALDAQVRTWIREGSQ